MTSLRHLELLHEAKPTHGTARAAVSRPAATGSLSAAVGAVHATLPRILLLLLLVPILPVPDRVEELAPHGLRNELAIAGEIHRGARGHVLLQQGDQARLHDQPLLMLAPTPWIWKLIPKKG